MVRHIPNRIHIIGSVGSGKTTLARSLEKKYNTKHYELDNVVWERHKCGDRKRSYPHRDRCLEEIIATESWIIEGAHSNSWVNRSFEAADLIIFLDTPYTIRQVRILKRFVRQVLRLETANYTPSFNMLIDMFKWNRIFERDSKPKILKAFQQEKCNFIHVTDRVKADDIF
ncbi:DNA topology modulation protein FlaR [Paenalkalicoccus suaedae]|uniref:DNA topology modulation protein FlaR n=1 Tax=Paenalkalicoccus suaedae TaxID=2592382 RepID=A0A859FCT7_9BACI|nr:AAA family ATPase [Paenalkalicoccus suaedae]QKS70658.1 DNA topology modulation protein FlaR [Paenalkalicoccus suaedae]